MTEYDTLTKKKAGRIAYF